MPFIPHLKEGGLLARELNQQLSNRFCLNKENCFFDLLNNQLRLSLNQPIVPIIKSSVLTGTSFEKVIVESEYAATRPVIDGVLTAGEWNEPAFHSNIQYSMGDTGKTGDVTGYFMNDDTNLYRQIGWGFKPK